MIRWQESDLDAYRKRKTEPAKAPPVRFKGTVLATQGHLVATLPLRLVNGSNERGGWWVRSKRAKAHRNAVRAAIRPDQLPALPVVVTITRLGFRALDHHDNLPIAAKHVVDALAELYGRPDNDPAFTWRYAQQRCPMGQYMGRIEITPRG